MRSNSSRVDALISGEGLTPYSGGLLPPLHNPNTPEQAVELTPPGRLEAILSDNGLAALQQGLITPEQAMDLPPNTLEKILNGNGWKALQQGLITPELAARLDLHLSPLSLPVMRSNSSRVDALISGEGLTPYSGGLLPPLHNPNTPEQAVELTPPGRLEAILSDNGLAALQKGLIRPKDALTMTTDEINFALKPVDDCLKEFHQKHGIDKNKLSIFAKSNIGINSTLESIIENALNESKQTRSRKILIELGWFKADGKSLRLSKAPLVVRDAYKTTIENKPKKAADEAPSPSEPPLRKPRK